jgi:YMGG-like Gly-zipper
MIRLTTSGALGLALASCALVLQAQAQTPGQTTGQTPGQKTEQPTGQTPGQTTAQTPARPSGKTLAASAGLMVYPAKGQRANQQAQDEAQCFEWARDQAGYDPMNPPPPPSAHSSEGPSSQADGDPARGALGGAVAGAAAGAAIGAIVGHAGKGAGIGATAGLLGGAMHGQQQAQAQAQATLEQQRAAQQELANAFKRGMSACLEARGYAVK